MIKITDSKTTKIVTRGAYESFYKPLGFNIVDEKKTIMAKEEPKKAEIVEPKKVETKEDDKVDEEHSKPIYKRK